MHGWGSEREKVMCGGRCEEDMGWGAAMKLGRGSWSFVQ